MARRNLPPAASPPGTTHPPFIETTSNGCLHLLVLPTPRRRVASLTPRRLLLTRRPRMPRALLRRFCRLFARLFFCHSIARARTPESSWSALTLGLDPCGSHLSGARSLLTLLLLCIWLLRPPYVLWWVEEGGHRVEAKRKGGDPLPRKPGAEPKLGSERAPRVRLSDPTPMESVTEAHPESDPRPSRAPGARAYWSAGSGRQASSAARS